MTHVVVSTLSCSHFSHGSPTEAPHLITYNCVERSISDNLRMMTSKAIYSQILQDPGTSRVPGESTAISLYL